MEAVHSSEMSVTIYQLTQSAHPRRLGCAFVELALLMDACTWYHINHDIFPGIPGTASSNFRSASPDSFINTTENCAPLSSYTKS